MTQNFQLEVEGRFIQITNPKKPLWPEIPIEKIDYLTYLINISSYLLPHLQNRLLTTIRFPHGIHETSFFQKNCPSYAPDWIQTYTWRKTRYILVNDLPTLIWLGNQACLEFHIPFQKYNQTSPSEIAFDLDPMDLENFDLVLECAILVKDILSSLGITAYPKTSGASGLQIFVPIEEKYSYDDTHQFNQFIAQYMVDKYPRFITIERFVKNRGKKLYFDYLQHGEGRTLPAPYSIRANALGSISTPVTWEEINKGFLPSDFSIHTVKDRVNQVGDLFKPILQVQTKQNIDEILTFINRSL
ncbi:bifunctional non-homologous end joining protein LigD [Seinonella peptonophila]|uniref:Bifunctional non-homologous end joining protein LigD n=1 Tax=Seinonella peptonophila TaxID=112248 RepID=A0A1M4T8Z5_9BACL|nr:non-homologous end-joining DNA ligase [Seinonella peptonophila]SHE40941.1 bifunctional non-homologous end joining protein LigD [Seinonella peptonophila]